MSTESPSNLSNLLRTAFSFVDVEDETDAAPIDYEGNPLFGTKGVPPELVQNSAAFVITVPPVPPDIEEDEDEDELADLYIMNPTVPAPSSQPARRAVDINGRTVDIAATQQTINAGNTPLFKKENRVALSADKRNDLFDKVTRTRTTKFDLVTLTLSEEDKLDDTYNLGIQVAQLRNHFIKYDMDDVFCIVYPTRLDASQISGRYSDLFTEYLNIQESDVAASNRWYNEHNEDEYQRQNLQLSFNYFKNKCTKGLWEKCLEDYDEYAPQEKGGTLLYITMMKKLQSHTDLAVQYLINSVKNLKISTYEGENVSRDISLIRGANKRLRNVTTLPEEYPKWVLLVFQTSTIDDFNKVFSHLKRDIEVVTPLMNGAKPRYPSVEDMLRLAEKLYLDMTAANEWTGVGTKGSAFLAGNSTHQLSCWNCGGIGHSLKECPKAANPTMIDRNKKLFHKNKKKGRKAGDKKDEKPVTDKKWDPPTAQEGNKRVIDGVPRNWLTRTKCWIKDRKVGASANVAAVVTPVTTQPTPTPVVTTIPSSALSVLSTATTNNGQQLAVANAAHSIQLAMQGLLNTFHDT